MPDNIDTVVNWLEGIPRADIAALRQTQEYSNFINAFQMLEQAHRNVTYTVREIRLDDQSESILECISDDDVVLRICEFLNCLHLVSLSKTCSHFYTLCNLSAKQRTAHLIEHFNLESSMKLLRAKEQAEGISPQSVSVRVPLLGLQKRVLVRDSGDPDYNGIYHCTGSNGNGFVFSKPKFDGNRDGYFVSDRDIRVTNTRRRRSNSNIGSHPGAVSSHGEEVFPSQTRDRFLRCLISKRFSNSVILWYMSKEIETENGEIKQEYSFWAKLMGTGEGTPDICRYPSQTSILSRNGTAWLSLSRNRMTTPPVVELVD